MSKFLSMPHIGIVVDAIYMNCTRQDSKQKPIRQLAMDANVCKRVIEDVRKILVAMNLLILEGTRRKQVCVWHPSKVKPNPVMLTEVYRAYTKDAKSRVKVEKKEKRLSAFESAVQTLENLGWSGELIHTSYDGRVTTFRKIHLGDNPRV